MRLLDGSVGLSGVIFRSDSVVVLRSISLYAYRYCKQSLVQIPIDEWWLIPVIISSDVISCSFASLLSNVTHCTKSPWLSFTTVTLVDTTS